MTILYSSNDYEVVEARTRDDVAVAQHFGSIAEAWAEGSVALARAKGSVAQALVKDSSAQARAEGSVAEALVKGSSAEHIDDTKLLASSDGYELRLWPSQRVTAGCRGPWTLAEALAHWGHRQDERAVLFTQALREIGKSV